MDYVIGVDQGATKTLAALADLQGNILSYGNAPGGSHVVTGLDHAITQVKIAVDQSVQGADAENDTLVAVGAGMTGADFPNEYTLLCNALEEKFGAPGTVVNDCMAALRAESNAVNSMVICGGTGLNIGILAPDGRQFVFGYYIDDCWQGGMSIGQYTLQMITEAELGMRPQTQLTERVLRYFREPTVDSLLEQMYMRDGKKCLKYLVPTVIECASEGDEMAIDILTYFADGCSRYAVAGLRRYDMLDRAITIYFSGSIFKNVESLLNTTIAATLQSENPQAKIVNAEFEPVVGGVMVALEKAYSGKIPSEVVQRVRGSARAIGLTRGK